MAYWYVSDVIQVTPPEDTKLTDFGTTTYPMLRLDVSETWKIKHVKSGVTRNVTFGNIVRASTVQAGLAYETDNPEPEVVLIRTEVPIPQSVIDECNSVAGGGQFVRQIDTIAERNALYAAYPSLRGRFPDQP